MRRKRSSQESVPSCCKFIWENAAVLKAQVVAWRVFFRKIATRSELLRRGVQLPSSSSNCALCGDAEETVNHLFFECRCVWDLWSNCLDWIGVQSPLSIQAADNLTLFCNLGRGKEKRMILATIWVCLVWLIWKNRNDFVFNEREWMKDKVLGEMKSYVWSWVKGKSVVHDTRQNFRSWSENPKLAG